MWLLGSLALALAVASVTGCTRDSKTYGATDAADVLRNHGFRVGVVARSDTERDLQKVFPQVAPEGVQSMVEEREVSYRPEGRGDLVLAALIFETQGQASCDESNLVGACLRKRNLVVVVRDSRAEAARAALDDLD